MDADAETAGGSLLDTVIKRGRLTVATYSAYPPMCFADKDGKLAGFEIDIARMIAKDLLGDPEKIDFQIVDSSGRWEAVLSGRADFGIAATTIYPTRIQRVAFTTRYMDDSNSMMVRKDAKVNSLADLNDSRITVADLSNPQGADRAKEFFPKAKILIFETSAAIFLAVKTGQAQAGQMDTPVAEWYAHNNQDLKVLPTPLGGVMTNNAIFMKQGDFTWWLYLDTLIRDIRIGSSYEQYKALFNKWFGHNPPPQRFYLKA